MTDNQKFWLKLASRVFAVITLVLVVRFTLFDGQDADSKPVGPPPLPILASIAPRYTLYLDPGDAKSLDVWKSVEYVLMQKSNTQFTLKSHVEGGGGVWESTIIIEPKSLAGTIQSEHNGTIESGVVELKPNQFGGFDYTSTYPGESKSRHAILKPQWWSQQN